jgi:hypothetical protein
MTKRRVLLHLLAACVLVRGAVAASSPPLELSPREIDWIGEKVFENECASKNEDLIGWNEGEDFLSLGIGHFIWYPAGRPGPFHESFPEYVRFAKKSGVQIPRWLDVPSFPPVPWDTRRAYLRGQNDVKLRQLRQFLLATKQTQAAFLVHRLERDFAVLVEAAPKKDRTRIQKQYKRLAATPAGTFALIDYVNFKGAGVLPAERYKGQGWGLLQVLEGMREAPDVLSEFVRVAENLLETRVRNSPPARNEQKWLPGWKRRVRSYLQ